MRDATKYRRRTLYLLSLLCTAIVVSGQPVADFTASPLSGCAPLVVQFTDNSSGNPSSWNWNFGNGNSATQKNPVTTYTTPGVYSVQLTVTNAAGSGSLTKYQYITVYDKPVVDFVAADSSGCIPFTTRFTDQSTTTSGEITSWQWDFDDGNTSTLRNPSHLYMQPGNFNITLQVTNSGGCSNSISKLSYIKTVDSIRTQFNFSQPVNCKPPETISFYNNSVGPGIISYTWDFGNGISVNSFSPSHTYAAGGLYTVTLSARSNFGCVDTLILKDTLFIKNVQSAISSDDTVCVNYRMLLSNTTVPAPLSSQWIYSDGTSSFSATTAKTWQAPGNYTVKLISNFNACSDSVTKNIRVLPTPAVNFSASDTAACSVPFTVTFNDLTPGSANRTWDFGDGTISHEPTPTHTYTVAGEYDVKLTVNSAAGCTASLTKNTFIKVHKPIINIDTKDGGGCVPYFFMPVPQVNAPDGISSYLWKFGNGNTSGEHLPTAMYTTEGSYDITLSVTSADGCIDSLVVPAGVRTAGFKPVIDFRLSDTVVCPGSAVQFTDLAVPADKWLWKFGDGTSSELQNPVHAYYDSGRYSVKLIVWNNGCNDSITQTQVLKVLPGFARFRPVYNCTDKREVLFKDSSVMPQSWTWNFGDGTSSVLQNPIHTYNAYGPYTVSLTTTNQSCTSTTTIPVRTVNEVPEFTASKNTLCKTDSVLFYAAVSDKNNIKKFIWNFGDGSFDSTILDKVQHIYRQAGSYTVSLTVIDTNNCSQTAVKNNFIHISAPKAHFVAGSRDGCRDKPFNFINTSFNESGNSNFIRSVWDFGDGTALTNTTPTENSITHVYAQTGYYYPSLKVTDSAGCADSVSYQLPVRIYQPVANFFAPNFNTCMADTLILRNPSAGTRLRYLWNFGDSTTSTDSLPVKQYAANGDYTIKLVVTDIAGCKDSMIKNNYVKVREVTASFSTSDSIGTCTPFQVKFNNTSLNALSQLWSFGNGSYSSTVNPVYTYTSRGEYIVRLTSRRSNRCFKTDSTRIVVNGIEASLEYVPNTGCSPLSVAFNVSSNDQLSYAWDFNDGFVSSTDIPQTTHVYTLPGTFLPSVLVKDSTGCILQLTGRDTIRLKGSKVNFSAVDSSICLGDSTRFKDSTYAGSSITDYLWDFGDGSTSTVQNPAYLYSQAGIYTVQLKVNTEFGCADSIVKTSYVKVSTTPSISITGNDTSYCGPNNILFSGNLVSGDSTSSYWRWDFGNGQISNSQYPAVQHYSDTGLYHIQLIIQQSSGCEDTACTSVRILPLPETLAGHDTTICLGTSALLTASGANTYTWLPSAYLSCNNCETPVATPVDNILYRVKGTNTAGCESTDSVLVLVKKNITLTGLRDTAVCSGKSIQLTVSGAENYLWSPAAGLSNIYSGNPVASPSAGTTYTVIGYDSIHCFHDTASVYVEVYSSPGVQAGADVILTEAKEVTLSPQFYGDIVRWQWQPSAGLSCNDCPRPVAFPSDGITYKIEVTSSKGCTASDDIFVQLKCDRNNIYMPTAFSPGGLGYNNNFCPLTAPGTGSLKITAFKIYNRQGQLIFVSGNFNTNDHSKGWNGQYNGTDAAPGAYVYTVEFVCSSGKTVSFNGNILLLR